MSRTWFLSYASADRAWVDQLAASLKEAGYDASVDHQDVECGTEWRTSYAEGLQKADAFVLVLSQQALTDEDLPRELSLAEEFARPIVAVQLEAAEEDADLKYRLAGVRRVSFIDVPWATAVARLVEALQPTSSGDSGGPSWTDGTMPGRRPPAPPPSRRRLRRSRLPQTALLLLAIALLAAAAYGFLSTHP